MRFSKNALHAYLSQFGSIKIMVWIVTLGVIAAYGLLDTEASQQMGNPYQQHGQYIQPLQQPVQQTGQFQQGNQQLPPNGQQPMMHPQQQMQQNGGYPNRSGSNYPSNTTNTYPNLQGGDYQQKEPLNYGY